MYPARYIFSKAPFPAYISYAVSSADTAYTISHFLWLHFLYHCSTVFSTLLPMLLSFLIFIYLFLGYILINSLPYLPEYMVRFFPQFIIWKTGNHYLVIAHKFNMLCVGIFLQNEDCEDIYLIFRLVQYIIKSGVFSWHISLFSSDTTILCFPLVIGAIYISSPLVSYS